MDRFFVVLYQAEFKVFACLTDKFLFFINCFIQSGLKSPFISNGGMFSLRVGGCSALRMNEQAQLCP